MSIEKQYFSKLAETVISNLLKRNMDAWYFDTKEDAMHHILKIIEEGSSVSWGGSITLEQLGLINKLERSGRYTLLDRAKVSPSEYSKIYHEALNCDYYLMSSNAITQDGKLVNIDGTGNRVAALIYGPKNVIVVAGMNKLATDESDAINRVHKIAAPFNAIRLNRNTPCAHTGLCQDCLSPDCICMQTVITRNSREKGRIKVILIGENLGY